ncbi:MAG TPA: NfeD family protein [Reyranella sp.]|nr:NfeD family protein [Reyranella sp.]
MFKVVFWYWWALAAVLLVCEMMLPGVVFLFLAIGAAVAGAMLLTAGDVSLEIQLVVFAIVSVVSAIGLRRYLRGLLPRASTLNARGESLVGQIFVLDQPILGGRGRIKLGDGSWSITGPDMVAGAKVRVAAVSGTELRVEPAP